MLNGAVSLVGFLALSLFLLVVLTALAAGTIQGVLDRLSRDRKPVVETLGVDPHDATETALPDDPRDE